MLRRLIAAAAVALSLGAASAQNTLEHPVGRDVIFDHDSGWLGNAKPDFRVVHQVEVNNRGTAWQRAYFRELSLEGDSFIRVTSMKDGEVQDLNAETAQMWSNSTAYFNGETILVELYAAPGTFNNRVVFDKVAVMDYPDGELGDPGQCGICGSDDRTPSAVNWSCRIMPIGCTATIHCRASVMVTAGHCLDTTSSLVVHFNVPASTAGCATVAPPVADQFPVVNKAFVNGGVGNDYGVFTTGVNSLSQTAFHRYGLIMPLGTVVTSGATTIRGYGLDTNCVRSQTQQLSTGSLLGGGSDRLEWTNDIRGGNSGSGLIGPSNTVIGVVTHCRNPTTCTAFGNGSIATMIDKAAFVTMRNGAPYNICNSTLRLLDVQSSGASGVGITVGTADVNSLQNGTTAFKRVYVNGVNVSLTAPATAGGMCFQTWVIDGSNVAGNPVSVAMTADRTAVAQYGSCSQPNDNCASAIDVSAGGTFNGTLVGATNDGTATCGASATNPDVWYRFTAPNCAGRLTATTCGTHDAAGQDTGMDTVLSLHTACGGTQLACNDDTSTCGSLDAGILRDSSVSADMTPGQTVWIRVSKFSTVASGPFRLNISYATPNDLCAGATPIGNGTFAFDNRCAGTDGPIDTTSCTFAGSAQVYGDLWWRYTATCSGTATVTTCGLTTHDAKMHVYGSNCPTGPNQQIACIDDSCGLQFTLSFPVTIGNQYLLRLGSFSSVTRGTGQFTVSCSSCPPCPADFNGSGGTPDDADVSAFFAAWNAGDPCADVNNSGGVPDDVDTTVFFALWGAGGC